MPHRRIFRIATVAAVGLLIASTTAAALARAQAQPAARSAHLTLLPDYVNGRVSVAGTVAATGTIDAAAASLRDWGLGGDLHAWPAEGSDTTFYLQGLLSNAALGASEVDHILVLGPLRIPPGDSLSVTVPFVSIDLDAVTPAPHNLDEVREARLPLTGLRYTAGAEPLELTLSIPFVPVNKEIDLKLVPLVGELLQRRPEAFRLYGEVIFHGIQDYATFERYCQATVEDARWPYRMADTLFTLDYLPVFHFGYLPPAYQYKPSYLLVRSELGSCSFEGGAGEVRTTITGRVFHQQPNPARFPDFLLSDDVPEGQAEVQQRGAGTGIYEVQFGTVFLAPGDLLKLTVPAADLRGISPAPARFAYGETGDTLAEFDGPAAFTLTLRYAPRPELFITQLPSAVRSFGAAAERALGSFHTGTWSWGPWAVLAAGVLAAAGAARLGERLSGWQIAVVWFVAAVLCYYSFPHVFGFILFAAGVHALTNSGSRPALARNGLTLLAGVAFLALDGLARRWIFMLDGYQLELTLFTPSVLILLGLVVYVIQRDPQAKVKWTPRLIVPPAIGLFALAALDGLGKSLPALLLAGGCALALALRYKAPPHKKSPDAAPDVPERFRRAWRSPFVWIGLLALAGFVITNDVTGSAAVLSPGLGVLRFLLAPALLFASVALSFLATGGLFLLLYPQLPFKEGYLKAIVFAAGWWLLFILGVGADDRLAVALPSMLAGRFIYYLSAPLLIGIFLESRSELDQAGAAAEARGRSGFSMDRIFEPLKALFGPVGSLVSLVAPGLYAWFTGQPLVTSYFDVLDVLIQFTLL